MEQTTKAACIENYLYTDCFIACCHLDMLCFMDLLALRASAFCWAASSFWVKDWGFSADTGLFLAFAIFSDFEITFTVSGFWGSFCSKRFTTSWGAGSHLPFTASSFIRKSTAFLVIAIFSVVWLMSFTAFFMVSVLPSLISCAVFSSHLRLIGSFSLIVAPVFHCL